MLERILVAFDGSDHSKKALEAAAELAKCSDGEVHVLHVHESGVMAPLETPGDATDLIEGAVEELHRAGVKATGDTIPARSGSAAPAILDAAKAFDSGIIVMGTRGLSDFSGLLVGSMAHKVIHHAECPVLVVR
jgi:nucleotide-binding universal stress UspA family protein